MKGDLAGQPSKGQGFTQTIIHKAGHVLGLMHPNQYGAVGDFTYSAMGYFTQDIGFGMSDKDALWRAYADQIYLSISDSIVRTIKNYPDAKRSLGDIRRLMEQFKNEYGKMNYLSALKKALDAKKKLEVALSKIGLPQIPLATYLIAAAIAIGCASAVVFLARRRRILLSQTSERERTRLGIASNVEFSELPATSRQHTSNSQPKFDASEWISSHLNVDVPTYSRIVLEQVSANQRRCPCDCVTFVRSAANPKVDSTLRLMSEIL